jgi:hypothetical protein
LVDPKDVDTPRDKVVVEGLELQSGNKCVMLECNYICTKESTAMVHARGHGWVMGKPKTWTKTHVQVRMFNIIDIDILRGAE